MNIEIANRLVQLRKNHNLSQEELAARIGVSRQAVSKWERAEASPDTDNLILLARLYGISLDELLTGSGAVPPDNPPPSKELAPLPPVKLLAAVSLSGAGGADLPAAGNIRPLVAPRLACILHHSVVLCSCGGKRPELGWGVSHSGGADLPAVGIFRPLVASRLADFFHHPLILYLKKRTLKDG